MILSVTLENFRQHQNLHVDFEQGLTVVRGANEAGKTTLFEAIAFAMFGVKSCRNNDITSWGAQPDSHKVTVKFETEGVVYKVVRKATSCELTYGSNGRVTGLNDVSRFCEDVLHLKPNTGNWLMFVPQADMKGILSQGTSKITELVEKLAGMDNVDTMIKNLQDNHPTGSVKHLSEGYDEMAAALEVLRASYAALPATADLTADQMTLEVDLKHHLGAVVEYRDRVNSLRETYTAALASTTEFNKQKVLKERLEQEVARLESLVEGRELKDVDSIEQRCNELRRAEANIVENNRNHKRMVLFSKRISEIDAACHGFPFGKVEEELKASHAAMKEAAEHRANLKYEIYEIQQRLEMYTGKCLACGLDYGNVPSLADKVQGYKDQLAAKNVELINSANDLNRAEADYSRIMCIDRVFGQLEADFEGMFDLNPSTTLESIKWTGPQFEKMELEDVWVKMDAEMAAATEARDWNAALKHNTSELTDARISLAELPELKLPEFSVEDLLAGLQKNEGRLTAAESSVTTTSNRISLIKSQLSDIAVRADSLIEQQQSRQSQMDGTLKLIESMGVNNRLLKELRAIKPKIANELWREVCTVVTTYFSSLRGVESVVTKDKLFMVDGRDTTSFSGSTLDILGLAIRVALTRMFHPNADFLLLDEPFSACDAERGMRALGFLSTLGFKQVVVVTHDEDSQSFADNLVEV